MALFILKEGFRVVATPTGGRVEHVRTGEAQEITPEQVRVLAQASTGGIDPDDPELKGLVKKFGALGILVRAAPAVPPGIAPVSSAPLPEAGAVVPRFRWKLVFTPHPTSGMQNVQDPDTGKTLQLHDFEVSLARMLDGRRRYDDVVASAARLGIPVTVPSLAAFARRLEQYGFVVKPGAPAPPEGEQAWSARAKWPEATRTLYQGGLRLFREGRYPEAFECFEAMLRLDANNPEAREMRRQTLERQAAADAREMPAQGSSGVFELLSFDDAGSASATASTSPAQPALQPGLDPAELAAIQQANTQPQFRAHQPAVDAAKLIEIQHAKTSQVATHRPVTADEPASARDTTAPQVPALNVPEARQVEPSPAPAADAVGDARVAGEAKKPAKRSYGRSIAIVVAVALTIGVGAGVVSARLQAGAPDPEVELAAQTAAAASAHPVEAPDAVALDVDAGAVAALAPLDAGLEAALVDAGADEPSEPVAAAPSRATEPKLNPDEPSKPVVDAGHMAAVAEATPPPAAGQSEAAWVVGKIIRRGRVTMAKVEAPAAGVLGWMVPAEQRVRKGASLGDISTPDGDSTRVAAPKDGILVPTAESGDTVTAGQVLASMLYHEAFLQVTMPGEALKGAKPTPEWRCEVVVEASGSQAPCKVITVTPRGTGFFVTATTEPRWFDDANGVVFRLAPE